jgi:hypothetical protein
MSSRSPRCSGGHAAFSQYTGAGSGKVKMVADRLQLEVSALAAENEQHARPDSAGSRHNSTRCVHFAGGWTARPHRA